MKVKLIKDFSFPTYIGIGVYKKGLTVRGKSHKLGLLIEHELYGYFDVIPKEYFKKLK